MARRVFFSFHYQNDIYRVNQIRNSNVVNGTSAAGFHDASLWEKVKKEGDQAIKNLIDRGLRNTSVTAVLIGSHTAERKYVDYEIQQSIARGNGLLVIYIHRLKDSNRRESVRGRVPNLLLDKGYSVYHWDRNQLKFWIETAHKNARSNQILKQKSIFLRIFNAVMFGGNAS